MSHKCQNSSIMLQGKFVEFRHLQNQKINNFKILLQILLISTIASHSVKIFCPSRSRLTHTKLHLQEQFKIILTHYLDIFITEDVNKYETKIYKNKSITNATADNLSTVATVAYQSLYF